MKIINKIKAFFRKNDEPVELDLVAAEIREGKAFLHTKGEESLTYMVRANDIEIRLNKDRSLGELDVLAVKRPPKGDRKRQNDSSVKRAGAPEENKKPGQGLAVGSNGGSGNNEDFDRFKKRKFVISVYPDEYDILMSSIKEYGYKRADFVLACVNTATKGTMEKAHKKIIKTHREIVLEQQALAAKKAAEAGKAS